MKNRMSTLVAAGALVALALIALGVVQGPASAAVLADTTPPAVTLTAPVSGAAIHNGQALTAAASDAGGIANVAFRYCAGTTCTWAKGVGIGTATTSPYAFTWIGQPADGAYALLARATDKAGNVNTTSAVAVTVDNTAPDTTIVTHPPLVSGTASATFTFTSEARATFACSLDGAAFTTCTSPKIYVNLAGGWHSFRARAIDRAGNVDATPSTVYWYANVASDTTPPETTIASHPATPTNATGATLTFSSEAGATFACSLDGAPYSGCSSPKSYTGLTDGSHTFSVRATDAAGNTDPTPASSTWTVDTVAPDTALASRPSSPTNSTDAAFTFASETGATFACALDGAAYTSCGSPKSYTGLGEGVHTFSVRAADAAGNIDATPASFTWTVDTTAPDTAIGGHPSALTNATSAGFTFSSEAGATFACALDGAAYSTCTSPKDLSGLKDGSHTFSVRATDAAGNTDATPATFTWTVDTTAPETTLDSTPAKLTNKASASFAFSSEAGATLACSLDGADYTTCNSPKELTSLTDGSHTFAVQATDAAGNTDGTPATFTWTVDTTAPDTRLETHPSALTTDASASFAFSSEAGTTFTCSLDGADYTGCDSPHNLSALKDGSHTFGVKATDAAGNTDGTPAEFTWTVDTTPPDAVFDEYPTSLTREKNARFNFSSEADASFECSLDGEPFYACAPPENAYNLSDGAHRFAVRATDKAGNRSDQATVRWTVDTVGPDVTIDGHPQKATNSTDARLVFSSEPDATIECSVDKASFIACTSPIDLSGLVDGDHSFAARATDAAGNTGDKATFDWTVDTVAPETTIGSHPAGLAKATDARFTFSSGEAATFECKLDQSAFEACSSPDELGTLTDGTHTLHVRAVDAAGNADPTPDSYTWTTDGTPPSASITSPGANATVSGLVTFAADVSDESGIGGVQFKVDGVDLGPEDPGPAPYRANWDTTAASNGPHTLSTETRDAAGNVTTTSIDVTVANEQPTTATPGLIAIGPGYVDATARQVVRTADDRAYIIAVDDSAYEARSGSAVIRAWRADTTGAPSGFAEADSANHPHPAASGVNNIVGVDLRLDRASGIVHTVRLESSGAGNLVYQTFDTHADRWSAADEDIASGVPGTGRGRGTFALAVDATGNPHVVYVSAGTLFYVQRVAGTWSSPVELATGSGLLHPSMAFDAAGNLHVAWLEDGTPAVEYKELHADGSWSATDTVASGDVLTNSNADQGVSVAANTAGVPYVLYLSASRGRFGSSNAVFGAVQIRYRAPDGTWQADDPAPSLLAHTPQLYLHGDDVYAFLGHDPEGHLAYAVHQPGRPWSAEQTLSGDADGFLDGAASVRFDVNDAYPGVIDSVFYCEDKLHDKSNLPQLYYRGVTPAEPPAPDTTAPSVSIDSPGADAVVSAAISVSAQASDDVGVTSVRFQLDGADLGSPDETAPYSVTWDTATVTDGTHALTAIARDAAGHETTSSGVTVTVQNSAPPVAPIALLGSDGIGSNVDFNAPGYAEAFQVTADADGSLGKLQVYLAADSAATSVLIGVYSDTGGDQPGSLLTQATLSVPVAGWNAVSVPSVPILAGTKLWIALLAPTGAGQVKFHDAKTGGLAVGDSAAGSELPTTWTTTDGPWHDGPLSAFGTT